MKEISVYVENALRNEACRSRYQDLLLRARECHRLAENKQGRGSDFLGWLSLPSQILSSSLLTEVEQTAKLLREECQYVVAIGIGGSYLGAKAVLSALGDSFESEREASGARVLFAGHHISEDYLHELLTLLEGKKFGLINISKSGTTTEPAIAFRLLKSLLEKQEGKDFAKRHIVAITDAEKGALRTLATEEGYQTYVIPDDVGGRFSVLTPVGLLPIAVAGYDIRALIEGAATMEQTLRADSGNVPNMAEAYAATRIALSASGKKIEILANYHPKMHYIGEWWKQLFGESEGKEQKGIFSATVDFTTDLHSMGQWIQEGERIIFETVLSIEEPKHKVLIPRDEHNLDGLNFLAGKRVDEVNKMAEQGTLLAHLDGGVPNIRISLPRLDEASIGQLFYFFEKSVAISGYLSEVNPFDQPGVEAYKRNMFGLLGKPGYEQDGEMLRRRLKDLSE